MGAVPEFLLRKLVVPGSLKPAGQGFIFEINNTFVPVTLLGFDLRSDGRACPPEQVTIINPGAKSASSDQITPQQPFELPVNTVVRVQVNALPPQKELTIQAETREAGLFRFSVPVKPAGSAPSGSARWRNFFQRLAYYPRILRARLDPQHPRVHFTSPANWMNDPNGLIYWKGLYHIFYQFNPFGAVWGNMHWGHAVSKELLHWRHMPIALAPDPQGADAGGCFSGCAVDNDGTASFLYTGVWPECQCLAEGVGEELKTMRKHSKPVIPAPPQGLEVEGFRDPCVWKQEGEWRMVIGSGLRGAGGAILLYRSADLVEWEYLGILCQGDGAQHALLWTGTMWECPSFFPLGDRWVLIISACSSDGPLYTLYWTGEYAHNRFTPDGPARLVDHGEGGCFYAPQTFLDEFNRRVIIGWLREARPPAEMARAGWSGAMAFPRILSLGSDGSLRAAPLGTLDALRRTHELLDRPGQVSAGSISPALEMCLTIPTQSIQWSGVEIFTGVDPSQVMRIGYDPERGMLAVDCRSTGGLLSEAPLTLSTAEDLFVRVWIDGSVLEAFAGDRAVISARFYLKHPENSRVRRVGSAGVELWSQAL